ncbi:MAG: thioredoxin-like domain-containing protein [Bacteroidales bacterium]|nr:thioredoxin-like domain-containing protein [Bacteroidales bacterium]
MAKFSYIRLFIIIGALIACNLQIKAQAYRIKAKIKGANEMEAQLAYYQGDKPVLVQNGKFDKNAQLTFEGNEKLPTGIYFIVIGNLGYFDLLIRDEQQFSLQSDTAGLINEMKVKVSADNEIFFDYQKKVLKLKTSIAENQSNIKLYNEQSDSVKLLKIENEKLEDHLNTLVETTQKKYPGSYLAKILHAMSISDVDKFNFADEDLLRTPFFHNMVRLFIKKNIEKNSAFIKSQTRQLLDSVKSTQANFEYIATYLLNFYSTFYKTGINDVFVFIADQYFLPDKAKWLSKEILSKINERRDFMAQSMPGMPAQDLKLESTTGEYFSLLQVESPLTFLYFWSADCGHCTTSTNILKENYEALSLKNVSIFAVNIDKDKDKWLKKIEETESPWLNCWDPEEVSGFRDKYYVYGTPLLYVIDANKKIIAFKNGETEIESLVNQIIEKKGK